MKYENRAATPAEQVDMGVDVPQVNCPYCQDRVGGCPDCIYGALTDEEFETRSAMTSLQLAFMYLGRSYFVTEVIGKGDKGVGRHIMNCHMAIWHGQFMEMLNEALGKEAT